MCNTLNLSKSHMVMYIFGHISVKQRQLPDQQVDYGLWVVQLCDSISGLIFPFPVTP